MTATATDTAPAQHTDWASAWAAGQAAAKDEPAGDAVEAAEPDAPEAEAEAEAEPVEAAESEADASDDESAEPEAETKPKGDRGEKVKTLEALAKELGLKVEAGGITTQDRAEFRAEKRKAKEKFDAERTRFAEQVRGAWSQLEPLAKAKELGDKGDYDGALKALFGKDVAGINEHYVETLRNPQQRELNELKRKLEEREAGERKREQEYAAQRAEAERVAEERRYVESLAGKFKAAEDIEVKRLAEVSPVFADLVFQKQRSEYDGYETVDESTAAAMVRDDLRATYDVLHQVFGDRGTQTHESQDESAGVGRGNATPAKDGSGKKSPPTTLPKRKAAEASPHSKEPVTEQEWTKKFAAKLRQADYGE